MIHTPIAAKEGLHAAKSRTFKIAASTLSEDTEADEVYLKLTITFDGVTPASEWSTVITGTWTGL